MNLKRWKRHFSFHLCLKKSLLVAHNNVLIHCKQRHVKLFVFFNWILLLAALRLFVSFLLWAACDIQQGNELATFQPWNPRSSDGGSVCRSLSPVVTHINEVSGVNRTWPVLAHPEVHANNCIERCGQFLLLISITKMFSVWATLVWINLFLTVSWWQPRATLFLKRNQKNTFLWAYTVDLTLRGQKYIKTSGTINSIMIW